LQKQKKQVEDVKANHIKQAFKILDQRNMGYVSRTAIMNIISILNADYDEIRKITENDANIMFALLDQDGSETIDLKEFYNFGTVILLQFKDFSRRTWFEYTFPTISCTSYYQRFGSIIQSEAFETAIDFAAIAQCIVVLIQSFPDLAGHEEIVASGMIEGTWEFMEGIFTLIYVLEMSVKIMVLGWDRYTSSLRHVFDGFITVVAFVTTMIVYYPNDFNNPKMIQVVMVLRIFRIVRLFMVMKSFRLFCRTFVGILPSVGKMIVLLFCIMYVFSAIGMHFFGGLVTRDPENVLSYLLKGTEFADNLYWANNFNDLLSGMNVIFNHLVGNNWDAMESGILAVTQTKESRWFFFAFYVVGVILVNNLVISLSIDAFIIELEDKDQDQDAGISNKISFRGKRLIFDANRLTREHDLSGCFEAHLSTEIHSVREKKKILANLFKDRGYNFINLEMCPSPARK